MKNITESVPVVKAPEFEGKKSQVQKLARTLVTSVLVSLLIGGIVGAWAVQSRYTPPMQGNEACKGAMVAHDKQLQASLNAQFGVPVPAGTPSLDDVKALQAKCDETYEMYVVERPTVEAAQ